MSKHAQCRYCKQPMTLASSDVRGQPAHGKCLLDHLRQQWRSATGAKRWLIEQQAQAVKAVVESFEVDSL